MPINRWCCGLVSAIGRKLRRLENGQVKVKNEQKASTKGFGTIHSLFSKLSKLSRLPSAKLLRYRIVHMFVSNGNVRVILKKHVNLLTKVCFTLESLNVILR